MAFTNYINGISVGVLNYGKKSDRPRLNKLNLFKGKSINWLMMSCIRPRLKLLLKAPSRYGLNRPMLKDLDGSIAHGKGTGV